MKTMRIGQHILEIEHHGFDIVTTMLNTVFYYLDVEKFSVHYLIQEKTSMVYPYKQRYKDYRAFMYKCTAQGLLATI